MSKGEDKIASILKEAGISFIREYQLSDYRNGLMRFDFMLPGRDVVIEVNGEQHYKYSKFFYKNKSDWLKARERDRMKCAYCLAHNIAMYCIPYWELDKIEDITDIFKDRFLVKDKFHNDKQTPVD